MCNRVGGFGGRADDPTGSSANRSNRCGTEVGFYVSRRRCSATMLGRWKSNIMLRTR
jgi:hypothetical protein